MMNCSGGSVGLPMPKSMTSMPSTRFLCFSLLILPKRYGGSRFTRSATGMVKGSSENEASVSLRMAVGGGKWGEEIGPETRGCASAPIGRRADFTNPPSDEKFVRGPHDIREPRHYFDEFVVGRRVVGRGVGGGARSTSASLVAAAGWTRFVDTPLPPV